MVDKKALEKRVVERAEARKKLFIERRKETGLNLTEWGVLFNLGSAANARQSVYKKEMEKEDKSGLSLKVNKAETLAAELLALLSREGYDIRSIGFDSSGRLVSISRREDEQP